MAHPSFPQYRILEDSEATALVQHAIDSIYNLNFHAADSVIEILDEKLGEYPGNLLLKAFYTNWKYKPLQEGKPGYEEFESHLNRSIALCEKMLEDNEEDEEANFYLMASHAFLAELHMNNGHKLKALGEAKSAYKFIKIGFDQLDNNPEFYFSSGIYNYYREKYPEENPFYKSFVWFFRSGDKKEGIEMLKTGAEEASFTRAECLTYLFHIYLRYEDQPQTAIRYARILKNRYPNNLHYIANYVENALRLGDYGQLMPLIQRLLDSPDAYYNYVGEIFLGNYFEQYIGDDDAALAHYTAANQNPETVVAREHHYDSILFLGLGRVYQGKGLAEEANEYLKKSVKAAAYRCYRDDAKELLKEK
jgi:tetratricopeptide (TPR) repeat protein